MTIARKLAMSLFGLSMLAGCDGNEADPGSASTEHKATSAQGTFSDAAAVSDGGNFGKSKSEAGASSDAVAVGSANGDSKPLLATKDGPVRIDVPLTQFVDGMIGTDQVPKSDTGSTEDLLGGFINPVANVPFGMLTWGPETTSVPGTWSPRGYHYSQTTITGFPLVNLSGVGCPSGGYFNFMPMVNANQSSATFKHENEKSSPGYYKVKLDDGAQTELTASAHSGAARFTFPAGVTPVLQIPGSSDVDIAAKTISGSEYGGGFCNNGQWYQIYFFGKTDAAFTASGSRLSFAPRAGADTVVGLKVGISYVSVENAKANLETEMVDQTFDTIRTFADAAWNKRLNSIQVTGGTDDNKIKFYTALYHSFFAPQIFSDVNGDYMAMSDTSDKANAGKDGTGRNRVQYTTFSSWDTYRSLAPLQALLTPEEASDQSQSLVNFASRCGPSGTLGTFPMWAESNTNSDIMPGDGASIIVAQNYVFGATNFDTAKARDIMIGTAEKTLETCADVTTRPGMDSYLRNGFIDQDWGLSNATSASTTMEYTNTDFAISRYVAALAARDSQLVIASEPPEAVTLLKRSGNWANLYNPDWKQVSGQSQPQPQPRNADGTWLDYVFDGGQDTYFREGNAEQYSYMVQHDIRGLYKKLITDNAATPNSEKDAVSRLDNFTKFLNSGESEPTLWIGNEPSFSVPFMYNWTSEPHKTQALVRRILTEQFSTKADGLPGNDDEGAMSSLYVWSAIGLYPELLAVPGVSLTSPLFEKAVIWQGEKQLMEINAKNVPARYISSVNLNGKPLDSTWVDLDLKSPMKIDFELGDKPTCWGSQPPAGKAPPSFSPDGQQTSLLVPGGGLCG